MTCNDINGGLIVDDPWFSHALCSVLNANPKWLSSRMFANLMDYNTSAFIVIWNLAQQTWESIYMTQTEATNAAELEDDASGFDWWPAAWRMAAVNVGFPGQTTSGSMKGGNLGTGLQMITGKDVTIVNVTTGTNPISQTDLTKIISTAPGSPVIMSIGPSASTLMSNTYYTVFSYTSSSDQVFLDGLDGANQTFTWSAAYKDVAQVAYLTGSPTLTV